jgi:diguanylate cyclase (GGDEF)-like protein
MNSVIASIVVGGLVLLCVRLYLTNLALQRRLSLAHQDHYDARHDELTGLLNRRGWGERIDKMIPASDTEKEMYLAMLDIDQFKRINDEHGHLVGDEVLEGFAARLKSAFSDEDRYTLTRIGGEEFTILAQESFNAIQLKLQQFIESLHKEPLMLQNTSITIACSVGIAAFSPNELPDRWVSRADRALYQAKRLGGNQICVGE